MQDTSLPIQVSTQSQSEQDAPQSCSFTFDSHPMMINDAMDLLDCMECANNGRWYETPVDFYGLARLFTSSAVYHQSPLFFKRNIISSCYQPHPLLSRQDFMAIALDYLIFGNFYVEIRRNRLGGILKLKHVPAKYMRVGIKPNQYWFTQSWKEAYEFKQGTIFHLKNPDIHQEIYGLPEYLSGMLSASLNKSATMFRISYYENGSHAGVIVYLNDPLADENGVESLKKSLTESRKGNAFKNLFVYSSKGKKDGLQILPFSQITAKDEFMNIKDATRDDMLAMHRVPPQLMGIIPNGSSSFGDVEKAARVFSINELTPVMESMKELNDTLGIDIIKFKPYALLETN